MSLLAQLDQRIRHHGGLIVSCQPVPGSPLDNPAIVAAMALAAEQAGAVALRIEGQANLQAVRPLVTVPVIGLIKRDLPDSPVRITPWLEDIDALAQGGADIIAIDGTQRQRPASVSALLAEIHRLGKVAMAGAGAITGVLLSSGGYIANQVQSDSAMLAIKACYLYIPALLIVASMLWIGRFYRLDDHYEQIRADLDAGRRAPPDPSVASGEKHAI